MNYYIQGDAAKAQQIKAAFEAKGYKCAHNCDSMNFLYYTINNHVTTTGIQSHTRQLIMRLAELGDYSELELPVEPKFKAEDRIVSKSGKSTIYRIISLHEERREYIVEIEHKDYHESCPWIAFEDQDDYELAPKPHYAIANFHAGMPVLVRDDESNDWRYVQFSHTRKMPSFRFVAGAFAWQQCIPFEGNEHLLGTTDMPSEEYINW